jgi:oligopeptide/dipeptide ABC transporter ATP-binding protein
VSDRIAVMYAGRIVEQGPASVVGVSPSHPYTQRLLDSVPVLDPAVQRERRHARKGTARRKDAAAQRATPDSCPYVDQCPLAEGVCTETRPTLQPGGPSGHEAACHLRMSGHGDAGPSLQGSRDV